MNPINGSSLAFPALESIHLLGILCGVGTAAVMNLRLLGVGGDAKSSPATVWRQTRFLTMAGLALAIFSGVLLLSIDPEQYLANYAFRYKMAFLLAALLFYYTMVRRAAARDRNSSIVAIVSLGLYALIPLCGIFIGYE